MIEARDREAPKAVSVAEAGRLLGISRASAYRLVQEGRLPAVRLRSITRVPVAGIDELLAGGDQVASRR